MGSLSALASGRKEPTDLFFTIVGSNMAIMRSFVPFPKQQTLALFGTATLRFSEDSNEVFILTRLPFGFLPFPVYLFSIFASAIAKIICPSLSHCSNSCQHRDPAVERRNPPPRFRQGAGALPEGVKTTTTHNPANLPLSYSVET